jgi:gamma-tubulin complex component 3
MARPAGEQLCLKRRVRGSSAAALKPPEPSQGGAIINGLAAFAKHGDPYARTLVARLLQAVCVPLLDMIRAWVFEGRLLSESCEFFITNQAPGESSQSPGRMQCAAQCPENLKVPPFGSSHRG